MTIIADKRQIGVDTVIPNNNFVLDIDNEGKLIISSGNYRKKQLKLLVYGSLIYGVE